MYASQTVPISILQIKTIYASYLILSKYKCLSSEPSGKTHFHFDALYFPEMKLKNTVLFYCFWLPDSVIERSYLAMPYTNE